VPDHPAATHPIHPTVLPLVPVPSPLLLSAALASPRPLGASHSGGVAGWGTPRAAQAVPQAALLVCSVEGALVDCNDAFAALTGCVVTTVTRGLGV
jgi:hypothetical protein